MRLSKSAAGNGEESRRAFRLNSVPEYSRIENSFQFQFSEFLKGAENQSNRGTYWLVTGMIARSARTVPSWVTAVSRRGKRRLSSLIQARN